MTNLTKQLPILICLLLCVSQQILCAQQSEETKKKSSPLNAVRREPPPPVKSLSFEANEQFEQMTAFWMPVDYKPKAYLLFATNMSEPRKPLEAIHWIDLAKKHQIGAISVGFKEKTGLVDLESAAVVMSKFVQDVSDRVYTKGLKPMVFASGKGAIWMHRAIQTNPSTYAFWSTREVVKHPMLKRGLNYPPGLIIVNDPAQYENARYFFQDLRRMSDKNRVGFLMATKDSTDPLFVDRFARDYLSAIFATGGQSGQWMNIYSKRNLEDATNGKAPPSPAQYAWLPDADLAGAWSVMHQERKLDPPPLVISKDIPGGSGTDNKLKLYVRAPGRAKLGAKIFGVVFEVRWFGSDAELEKRLQGNGDISLAQADNRSRVLISLNAKSFGYVTDLATSIREQDLVSRAAEIKPVLDAVVRTAVEVCKQYGWPEKDWALFGDRTGAHVAQALLSQHSSRFLGVHLHSEPLYMPPQPGYERLIWLISSGGRDSSLEPARAFYSSAVKSGWPASFHAPAEADGTTSALTKLIGWTHFAHAGNMRFAAMAAASTAPKTQPSDKALEKIKDAHAYVNLLTNAAYPPAEKDKVAEALRMPIPTGEYLEAWRLTAVPRANSVLPSAVSPESEQVRKVVPGPPVFTPAPASSARSPSGILSPIQQ